MARTFLKAVPAAGTLQDIPSKISETVSNGLPRLVETARNAGRSVTDSVAGLAHSAGDRMERGVTGQDALKATTLAVVSTAALQAAQRSVFRAAARRPLLFVLGGAALVGWMLSRRKAGADVEESKGGDKAKRGEVSRRAKPAKKASDNRERSDPEAADQPGRRRARS